MFSIRADSEQNVIYLHFFDNFDAKQGQSLCGMLPGYMDKLNPGFTLFSDLSRLKKMDLKVHKYIEEIMDVCNEHGVSKVIRLANRNTPDIGFNIMSLFHYSNNVTILTCDSKDDVELYLKTEKL